MKRIRNGKNVEKENFFPQILIYFKDNGMFKAKILMF